LTAVHGFDRGLRIYERKANALAIGCDIDMLKAWAKSLGKWVPQERIPIALECKDFFRKVPDHFIEYGATDSILRRTGSTWCRTCRVLPGRDNCVDCEPASKKEFKYVLMAKNSLISAMCSLHIGVRPTFGYFLQFPALAWADFNMLLRDNERWRFFCGMPEPQEDATKIIIRGSWFMDNISQIKEWKARGDIVLEREIHKRVRMDRQAFKRAKRRKGTLDLNKNVIIPAFEFEMAEQRIPRVYPEDLIDYEEFEIEWISSCVKVLKRLREFAVSS